MLDTHRGRKGNKLKRRQEREREARQNESESKVGGKNSLKLEKWFPLQGERAHSLKFFVCIYVRLRKQNRKEKQEEETEQQQTY